MPTILNLFFQFFRTGLFSFGGGYATLPFLYEISSKFGWYTGSQLSKVLAVASVTPGPVGINMATFAGFITEGIAGAIVSTIAIILPSLIIVSIVFNLIDKFKDSEYILEILKVLKPVGCALLTSVGIKLIFTSNLHLTGTIILLIILTTTFIKIADVIVYLGCTAIIGFLAGHWHLIGI